MILALLACVKPAPLPTWSGQAEVRVERRDELARNGAPCLWEAEQLLANGAPVWTTARPDDELWCTTGSEVARIVDIRRGVGPYLSTVLATMDEQGRWTQRCVTWDLRTRAPLPLDAYDPAAGEAWWDAARARARTEAPGWHLDRDAWLLRPDGVAFCAQRDGEIREVTVATGSRRRR